jgi:hypothetical protein
MGLTLFHTGIVVDDLDASMATLSSLSGLRFAPPQVTETRMVGPNGYIPRRVRFTYSIDGPHYVELLQQLSTEAYEPLTGGRRVHHLGYLAKDLEADAKTLEEAGFRMEMRGMDEQGGYSRATYHYSDLFPGVWIELVAPETWSSLQSWIDEARVEADRA